MLPPIYKIWTEKCINGNHKKKALKIELRNQSRRDILTEQVFFWQNSAMLNEVIFNNDCFIPFSIIEKNARMHIDDF